MAKVEDRKQRLVDMRAQHVKDKDFKKLLANITTAVKRLRHDMGERVEGMHKIDKKGGGVDSFFSAVKGKITDRLTQRKKQKTKSVFKD